MITEKRSREMKKKKLKFRPKPQPQPKVICDCCGEMVDHKSRSGYCERCEMDALMEKENP